MGMCAWFDNSLHSHAYHQIFFFFIGLFTQHSRERSISSSEKYDCENVNYQQPTDTAFCLPKLIVTQFYMATDTVHLIQHRIFIQISTASLAVSLSNLNRKKKNRWVILDPEEARKEHMLINENPTKLFLQLLPKVEVCTLQMSSFPRSCLEL